MVESSRRQRDTQQSSARRETEPTLGEMDERRGLGIFADLLAGSKRGRQ